MTATAIASLSDAKTELGITTTDHDTQLQGMLDAANEQVEQRCGPVVVQSFTEQHREQARMVCLLRHRIQSVTSLTLLVDGSAPIDLANIGFDPDGGTVYLLSGDQFPWQPWQITYTAGFPTIPPSLTQAALVITKQLWEITRGNSGRPGVFGDPNSSRMSTTQANYVYTGYALPSRALELMQPFVTVDVL